MRDYSDIAYEECEAILDALVGEDTETLEEKIDDEADIFVDSMGHLSKDDLITAVAESNLSFFSHTIEAVDAEAGDDTFAADCEGVMDASFGGGAPNEVKVRFRMEENEDGEITVSEMDIR